MPIEDVDYLRKNSIRQSYIFLIDSIDRDHMSYPVPSEYTIEFTVPFHNVIGLEVIDASIPRTEYNVDVHNNKLSFLIHDDSVDGFDTTLYHTVEVETGDYTIQTLIPALNKVLMMPLNGTGDTMSITAEAVSNPPEVKSTIRFRCPYKFGFDMSKSTITETLGFDVFVQASEEQKTSTAKRYTFLDPIRYPRLFHSVDLEPTVALGAERTIFEGPRGVVRKLPLGKVGQQFRVTSEGYLTQLFVAMTTTDGTIVNTSRGKWSLFTDQNGLPHTQIPLVDNQGNPNDGIIPISITNGAYSDLETLTFNSLSVGTYWIVLESSEQDNFVFYNDVPTYQEQGACKVYQDGTWTSIDTEEGIHFELSLKIIMQDRYHVLTSPGIYSLVGEPYVVLRCPEVEENSYRSLAFTKHCLGLAKFRLGVVGYSENRMDFSKVPTREFHPIGKLPKMTLRFETRSGRLYDFKGVNHTITFAIHYLEPTQKGVFERSILNPNYNGNVIEYMYHQEEQEEDSDDQEYDYNRDTLNEYRMQEARHLPENVRRLDLEAMYRMQRLMDSDEESA